MIKYYKNGYEFYQENKNIIEENLIETSFFKLNYPSIDDFSSLDYCIKIIEGSSYLIALNKHPYNLLLFGNYLLCDKLAYEIYTHNLNINGVLASEELTNSFITHYTKYAKCEFDDAVSMGLLISNTLNEINDAKKINENDLEQIKQFNNQFHLEIYNHLPYDTNININEFYVYKENNEIVSMAKRTREEDTICAISLVYTPIKHRGKGYAKKVVSTIRNDIVKSGKTAYLYVDNNNPISTHLYYSIGFSLLNNRKEIKIKDSKIKRCVFAGGCFWCISNAFYNVPGVIEVYSGYTGGIEVNPSYELVKTGTTNHKEAIMIEYDESVISYEYLLKIFFENIDPFDEGGQFIDRGTNYQTAVYTNNNNEIETFNKIVDYVQEKYNKDVKVQLHKLSVFNFAEYEHQNFALKHPDEMKKEEITSGRTAYNKIQID